MLVTFNKTLFIFVVCNKQKRVLTLKQMGMKTKKETTQGKVARLERKRRALELDKRQFGVYPDIDEDETEELKWLEYQKEKMAELRADYLEEKRRGL